MGFLWVFACWPFGGDGPMVDDAVAEAVKAEESGGEREEENGIQI